MQIKTRLEKLEAALLPCGIECVSMVDGETREECIRRHGFEPGARGTVFICLDAADQRA
jgi:hypothetical protein